MARAVQSDNFIPEVDPKRPAGHGEHVALPVQPQAHCQPLSLPVYHPAGHREAVELVEPGAQAKPAEQAPVHNIEPMIILCWSGRKRGRG